MKLFSPKKLLIIGVAIFAIGCSSSAATPSATPDMTDGVPVPSATAVVSRRLRVLTAEHSPWLPQPRSLIVTSIKRCKRL